MPVKLIHLCLHCKSLKKYSLSDRSSCVSLMIIIIMNNTRTRLMVRVPVQQELMYQGRQLWWWRSWWFQQKALLVFLQPKPEQDRTARPPGRTHSTQAHEKTFSFQDYSVIVLFEHRAVQHSYLHLSLFPVVVVPQHHLAVLSPTRHHGAILQDTYREYPALVGARHHLADAVTACRSEWSFLT